MRDSAVEPSPDVRSDVAPIDPARRVPRYLEPRRSILTNDQVGRLAIPFQENDGQWPEDVAFKADHFAGSLWVTNDGSIVYSLLGPETEETSPSTNSFQLGSSIALPNAVSDPFGLHRAPSTLVEVTRPSSTAIDIPPERAVHDPFERHHELPSRGPGWTLVEHFVHGHPHRPRGLDPAVTNVSYFIGNDESKWAPHVSTFGGITLGEVWPGIEVRLVARGNNVEKFFHVRPHRDPSLIEMSIEGSEPLRLSDEGALIVATGNGEVELSPPVAFQVINGERREVAVRYELLRDDSYRFILGDYDRGYEVVVDPILQSTYLGGSGTDETYTGMSIDSAGHVLVSGVSASANYPGTLGGAQATFSGGPSDIVISRLNGSLTTLLQSTYLGGSNNDYNHGGIGIDSAGNVLVSGASLSNDYPGTLGGAQPSIAGAQDIVISRLNGTLTTLLQSTYLGGSDNDYNDGGIIIDSASNLLVSGFSYSNNYPGRLGGAQPSRAGSQDIVISRLNGSLTALLQSTYLGGSDYDSTSRGTTIDGAGNVLVAGYSRSTNYPGTLGGAQPGYGGNDDIVISRLNGTLTALLQSTYLGGLDFEQTYGGISIDSVGNVLVAGFAGSNYPGTLGGAQTSFGGGGSDIVISRLNASLTALLQSTYLGGSGGDYDYGGIGIDSAGNVLVAGHSTSTNYPGTLGGAQSSLGGNYDNVISRLNGSLTALLQSTYLGGSIFDATNGGISIDSVGNVLVSGRGISGNYPGTLGGAQPSYGGSTDIIISRLTPDLLGCSTNSECLTNPGGGLIFSGRPQCNVATRQCVACLTNADCEDGNLCTTNTCNVGPGTCSTTNVSAGTACRAATDVCDLAEVCPGGGAPCPVNALRPNGFSCRASSGTCDLAETCDGLSASCPPDTNYASAATVCRLSADLCDLAENCTGSSNVCPTNAFASPSTQCRAPSGECDVAEFCDGTTAPCPSDDFNPSGTSCTGGVCNGANTCVECILSPDCADGNPCTINICASSSCQVTNVGAGVPCGAGLSCNGNGSCTGCTMPSQCADGNDCTQDLCNAGTCDNPPQSEGANCPTGVCEVDGTPSCVECVSNAQCSGATPSCDIATHTCVSCVQNIDCDDGNACTNDLCNLGSCNRSPLTEAVTCPGGLCSASGMCIQCLSDTDCSGATPLCDLTSNQCVDCTNPNVTCPNGTRCDSTAQMCVPNTGCSSDTECSSPTPTCNLSNRMCMGCGDGSVVCPSNLLCDPDTGHCGLDPTQDADDDGILNGIECAPLINCPDSDGDNTPDYLDADDDGDSVPTRAECPNSTMCPDTEGDGISNYLDADDDGDGISTLNEVSDGILHGADADLDGLPNYLDLDSDGDGSFDRVEGRNSSPNSIPAYLDVNFLGGGGIAGGALRCTVDTRTQDTPMALFVLCAISLTFVRRRHLR